MPNSSSIFSFSGDTFLSTKNRLKNKNVLPVPSEPSVHDTLNLKNNTSHNNSISTSMSTTNRFHNLPTHEVSPYQPINPLIESPFKPSKFESSFIQAPRPVNNNDAVDGSNLLKMKIKAHQRMFQDNVKVTSPIEIDNTTYLQSAFNSKRNYLSDPIKQLKHINTSQGQAKKKPELTILNKDINDPYFAEALGRIVNKEIELKKLLFSILVFAVYRFLRSIVRLFVYTSPMIAQTCKTLSTYLSEKAALSDDLSSFILLKIATMCTFESLLNTGSYFELILTSILVFLIVTSFYRLLKPQDKCLDLPLTKAQRKILGLIIKEDSSENDLIEEEEEDSEKIMKRLLSASPQRIEQPVKIIVPDNESIDGVMGSFNGLELRSQQEGASQKWNSSVFKEQTNITPSGKYMYKMNNELRSNNSFY